MIGLKGVRVIVVDDEEKEALPIMKLLSKKGIACAFFDNQVDFLPNKGEALMGVRLAILDMDLTGGGVPEKSKISALVSSLERIISSKNGPYGILAWTKHVNLVEQFDEVIFSKKEMARPIFITTLGKEQCKDKNGNLDPEVIAKKLVAELSKVSPLHFLQVWEEKSFFAATEVTNLLCDSGGDEKEPSKWRDNWKVQTLSVIRALSEEALGEQFNDETALLGLYESLNPLHSDGMERASTGIAKSFSGKTAEIVKAPDDCGGDRKAKINSMLHLAFDNSTLVLSGNIYKFDPGKEPDWVPICGSILDDLLQKELKTLEIKKELLNCCSSVIIEINPVCDHSQGNVRFARFLAGISIPLDKRNKLKKPSDFFWQLGPLSLMSGGHSTERVIIFSGRHLVTKPLDAIATLPVYTRLRSQALTELQTWFAHHSSRQGKILLK